MTDLFESVELVQRVVEERSDGVQLEQRQVVQLGVGRVGLEEGVHRGAQLRHADVPDVLTHDTGTALGAIHERK